MGIKIREAKKTPEAVEFVPSLSVTASHDDFVKILTQKLDLATAETFGICHVRNWGNSTAKIELDKFLAELNNVDVPFIP